MSTRLFAWGYLTLSCLVLYVASHYAVSTAIRSGTDDAVWAPLVNIRHNAYHLWRYDRVSTYSSELLNALAATVRAPSVSPSLIQALVLFIGTLLVALALRPNKAIPHASILFISCTPAVLLLCAVGWDPVVLGTFAWLPIMAVASSALVVAERQGKVLSVLPLWLVGGVVSIQHSLTANHMALLSALGSLVLALACTAATASSEKNSVDSKGLPTAQGGTACWLTPLIVMGPALLVSFFAVPEAPFPNYPALAHVVPDDGLDGMIRPLVGQDYPLPVIDRGEVKSLYQNPSLTLLIIALLSWLFTRKQIRRSDSHILQAAIILLSVVALDTTLPEHLAVIAPTMSISRLIPWGTTFCVTAILLAGGAWLLGISLLTNPRKTVSLSLLTIGIATTGFFEFRNYSARSAESAHLQHPSLAAFVTSPSNALLRREMRATGTPPELFSETLSLLARGAAQSIGALEPEVNGRSTTTAKRLRNLIDDNNATHWSTRGKAQQGSEHLSLRFQRPITLRGIELNTGNAPAEFPRGLQIDSGSCDNPTKTLATYPSWQGTIATSTDGYPYFLGQHDVRVVFPHSVELQDICIRQTGVSVFDWTVSEIKILSTDPSAPTAASGVSTSISHF